MRIRIGMLCGLIVAAVFGLAINRAMAQAYPTRPITMIIPFPAGGNLEIVARPLAARLSASLGQPVIIENRPGGAGNVAAVAIKNAQPDGYLLMMGHTGTHAINPTLYTDLKFDPVKDFQPITAVISFNNILVVPAESPAQSVKDVVALGVLEYRCEGLCAGDHVRIGSGP